jgi:hypothetical protein
VARTVIEYCQLTPAVTRSMDGSAGSYTSDQSTRPDQVAVMVPADAIDARGAVARAGATVVHTSPSVQIAIGSARDPGTFQPVRLITSPLVS